MARLTDQERQEIIRFIEADKPLPDKYRFLLFEDKREVELVWNGKTSEVCNIVLPFQGYCQVKWNSGSSGKWGGAASQRPGRGNCRTMQTVEKQLVLEENWQVLAVVFPPFAQRLENSVITGLLAQFDVARSFPQFPRPLLLQPTILTSERGTRFGIRKAPNHVPTSPFTG